MGRQLTSRSQIDRLGDRLRRIKPLAESDLRALAEYRHSFGAAYLSVVQEISAKMNIEPTGRSEKTISSIIAKLQRGSMKLSQMQDIAGCRIVCRDVAEQETAIMGLQKIFSKTKLVDRRTTPSFGYRAAHVIVSIDGKPIEVQVRSNWQHRWAAFSESLSDTEDPAIKYGGGPKEIRDMLSTLSAKVSSLEEKELKIASLEDTEDSIQVEVQKEMKKLEEEIATLIDGYYNNKDQTGTIRRRP